MTRSLALTRAQTLRTALLDHGVRAVSIELVVGRAAGGWSDDRFVATMGHHIVSRRSQGPTSHLALIKRGRSDLPGPLANGYGGWDETARIICMAWANHAGQGGPYTVPAGTIPENGGRPYFFGWEFEGGINVDEWTDSYRAFMASCLAGTLDWLGQDDRAHLEHKTWAPGRKVDRLGYTIERARQEIREQGDDMVDRKSKADDGNPAFAPVFDEYIDAGVYSQYTQPGGVTFNDEQAVFLKRAGVRPVKGAQTWTREEIRALAAKMAAGGGAAAIAAERIIEALRGIG